MTELGCMFWLCVLGVVVYEGGLQAVGRGGSAWAGMGWGVLAWVAVMAGYGAGLTVVDWWLAGRYPNRVKDPWWMVPGVWVVFVGAAVGTVLVGRVVFGRA